MMPADRFERWVQEALPTCQMREHDFRSLMFTSMALGAHLRWEREALGLPTSVEFQRG